VLKFEREFLDYLRLSKAGILDGIRETLKFEDSTESELSAAYDDFLGQFETSEGGSVKPGSTTAEALEDGDVAQEQIVKQKRG
jgi:F-type H+-transporting ATPase subunit alpha